MNLKEQEEFKKSEEYKKALNRYYSLYPFHKFFYGEEIASKIEEEFKNFHR